MSKRIISVEIPDELREKLRLEAYKKDITVSALIRDLLVQALKEKNIDGRYKK